MFSFTGFSGGSPGFRFRMDCIHTLCHPPITLCLSGLNIGMYFVKMLSLSGIS